jgi:hypothetical protein
MSVCICDRLPRPLLSSLPSPPSLLYLDCTYPDSVTDHILSTVPIQYVYAQ